MKESTREALVFVGTGILVVLVFAAPKLWALLAG